MTAVVRVPADQAARDQIRTELEVTLNVVAGAGTGKTHELVERVVGLLRTVPMNEIGVITFTTAAASELQERIRERVEELAAPEGGDGPYTRALHALDDAAISTLHAFAQRILTDHPLEASLPPGFEVLDAIQESVAFEDWWQRTLDRVFADESLTESLLVLGALGVKPNRYRQIARILSEHHDRTAGYGVVPSAVPRLDLLPLLDAIDVATELRDGCRDPADRLRMHLDTLDELGGRLRELQHDELEALALLGERANLKCNLGKQTNWPNDGKEAAAKACAIVQDARDAAVAAVTQPAILTVLAALVREVANAAKRRRHDGRVTFHDLLVIARNLLREDGRVREALAARFRVLLLDEFQDTDPLQIDLALLIAGAANEAEQAAGWSDITPRPGALFVVGDPKQSIYRFRRADIELYGRVITTLTDAVLELTESFRSRPGIIDWVNTTLGALIKDEGSGLQVAYSPLHAFRPADPEVPVPVARLGGPVPKGSCSLGDLRVREAAELAALARRVRGDGWRVQAEAGEPGAEQLDPSTDEWVRPARFSDIAVLLPTRTLLPDLEEAFAAADVPLRIESQSLLFATTECRDLVSILGAIDDPADEVRIVAALRTPAFGCSDADLLDYRSAGGRWSIFRSAPEDLAPDHPVVTGLADLRALHDEHRWETPADTVERVVRERNLFTLALANRRPRDHWRRLRFLTDAAHAFTNAGGASLRGFVQWLDEQREEGARVNESVVAEPDDDAVRVLTVHGSKGLEVPVVLLAGLGVAFRATPAALYHGDPDPELRLTTTSTGTYATVGYADRSSREETADRHEGMRLLYVATTRARDHLVVALHHVDGTKCHAAEIERVDAEHELPWRVETAEPAPAADPVAVQLRWDAELPPAPMDGDERDAWWSERLAAIARAGARPVIAATGIAHALRPAPEPEREPDLEMDPLAAEAREAEPEDERPAWRRGRGATALGRAVHAVLQTADLATGAGIEGAARAQALAEGIPEREETIGALARSVLETPTIRAACSSGRSWREVPVAAVIEGVTVEGFIDLLFEDDGELIVVDYKTDTARTDAELDAALERYRLQGAAYALALEHVLRRPVGKCVFVFARAKGPGVEREVADLRALVEEVRSQLPTAAR
ncbi:MAG: UvrD-helicase domain-containing protein [Acidimicrobiia bacterium]